MRKRNHAVTIRMNDEEYQCLQERIRASGQTQQNVMIKAIEGVQIATDQELAEVSQINCRLADLNRQIRGMAVNVNQMAHVANASDRLPESMVLDELKTEIHEFRKECDEIWRSIRRLISRQAPMGQCGTV